MRTLEPSDGAFLGGRCAFVRDAALWSPAHTVDGDSQSHQPQEGSNASCGDGANERCSLVLTAIQSFVE